MTLSGVVDFASLSRARFFFLSFAKKGVCLKKRPNNVFGFFPLRTGKGAALLRTHHHRSPHLTHSTGVLKCALPKKEEGRSSLLDVFFHKKKREIFWWVPFARRRLLCSRIQRHEKKNRKTHPKNIVFYITQNLLGLSKAPKKRRRRRRTGNRPHSSNRPTTTARGNPCFFDARARERERETFSSSGVAFERSGFIIASLFESPQHLFCGVQIFNRNADDASGRRREMSAAQTAEQQHAQTANDALVYVRTVKLRFAGDQSHVYEAFLDIMRDFKSGRYVPLSRDSPSFAKIPSDHICTLCFSFLERKRQIRHDRRRQTRQKAPQRPRGLTRWVQLLLTRRE